MVAIRVKKHIDSLELHLPQLKELMGRDVEIIIISRPQHKPARADNKYPLRGTAIRYDQPFEPVDEEEWEALKEPPPAPYGSALHAPKRSKSRKPKG